MSGVSIKTELKSAFNAPETDTLAVATALPAMLPKFIEEDWVKISVNLSDGDFNCKESAFKSPVIVTVPVTLALPEIVTLPVIVVFPLIPTAPVIVVDAVIETPVATMETVSLVATIAT